MLMLTVALLLGLAAAAPPPSKYYNDPAYRNPNHVQILRYENEHTDYGHHFILEQSDGTKLEQYGELKNKGGDDEYYELKGSYSWLGPNGILYTVTYVADKDGYQPETEEGPGALPPNLFASMVGG